jgi:hypothetical protein
LRVLDLPDLADQSVFLEVTTALNQRFVLVFGSESDAADRTVIRYLQSTSSHLEFKQQTVLPGRTDYFTVDLASDGTEVDFFVDGRHYFPGFTLAGFNQPSVPGRVLWGSGSSPTTGHARFAEVHYAFGLQQCRNMIDDDGDGLVDALDPDCQSPLDPREQGPVIPCDDGVDTDADGLCDADERLFLLSRNGADFDRDGLLDGAEVLAGTDPKAADSDGDGASDGIEVALATDPNDPDSDDDGLVDGDEIAVTEVVVTPATFDGALGGLPGADAICEAEAITRGMPDPTTARAWLSDSAVDARDRIPIGPYARFGSGETIAVDFDDLTDGSLVNGLTPSPAVLTWTGTDTAGFATSPNCADWSTTSGVGKTGSSNVTNAAWTYFGPNFSCANLRALGCFARDPKFGTDPNDADSDGDGLLDGAEVSTHATNPAVADTDLDGFDDGAEVAAGTDPLDIFDFPTSVPVSGALARIALLGALVLLGSVRSFSASR